MKNIKYIKVEIADTPEKYEKGLMFRHSLNDDRGMIFLFPNNQILKFWGMNTYIPLSIAFVSNKKIVKIGRIKPFSLEGISSDQECDIAIEACDDYFDNNNIKVGDKIVIEKNENGEDIVSFDKLKYEIRDIMQ